MIFLAAILGAAVILLTFCLGYYFGGQRVPTVVVQPRLIELVEAAIKTATVDALHGKLRGTSSRESN